MVEQGEGKRTWNIPLTTPKVGISGIKVDKPELFMIDEKLGKSSDFIR